MLAASYWDNIHTLRGNCRYIDHLAQTEGDAPVAHPSHHMTALAPPLPVDRYQLAMP